MDNSHLLYTDSSKAFSIFVVNTAIYTGHREFSLKLKEDIILIVYRCGIKYQCGLEVIRPFVNGL